MVFLPFIPMTSSFVPAFHVRPSGKKTPAHFTRFFASGVFLLGKNTWPSASDKTIP
jgi:hypothetical protein